MNPEEPSIKPNTRHHAPEYKFTQKFTAHVKLHVMSGVTFLPWIRVLLTYAREIHWHLYWHRVIFLTLMSIVNSILAIPDWLRFNRRIANQQLHAEPVFILGNPRTGTTHLHNLLSLDPQFAFANTFQAGFPSSFITLEEVGFRPLLQPLLSPTRPMDNMKLTWDTPAEDEIAVNCLNGGISYYMPLVMPCCEKDMRPYLTLTSLNTETLSQWSDAFMWFMKKVTFADLYRRSKRQGHESDATPRPLLIKSPVHTARLGTWRAMFPKAKYIFIHRHPVDVFKSSAHMVDTYFWYCYLQRPTDRQLTDYILDQYDIMNESYMKERQHVPPGQLAEVRFDNLDKDPINTLKEIYDQFGWTDRFEGLRPRFQQYRAGLSDFKKNQLNKLSPDMEAEVRRRWAPSFREFGYQ